MKKLIILFVIMAISLPCYAQKIVAETMNDDVVLKDVDSGKKWKAKKGSIIGDQWEVLSVSSEFVVIERKEENSRKVRGILPVKNSKRQVAK